ncbi:sulfatase family protein [Nitrosopumilus sp.]|uniref:sulfatase family protein n=1 Tax=Nitrosopumilus sp. TaxID=2024843 RepID=UPI003D0A1433
MKPNIIFVLLDGSRYDRINESPEFVELLKEGTLLNNVSTAIPYTFGSINVIFSGEYGKTNGVNGYYKVANLKPEIPFLPEILHDNGYFTSRSLINDDILSPRGFDIREDFNEYKIDLNNEHTKFIKETFKNANGKPFFTFLQYTKIHTITVTEVLKKFEWDDKLFYENQQKNLKQYDEIFKETGHYAKNIFHTIKELGILNNTIIVFFTDHGTGVGERFGERNYGSFTFEETIRTFYTFVGQKIRKSSVSNSLLSTIDIMPTILEICNIDIPKNLKGKSFFKFLIGNEKKVDDREFTFSETGALHGPYPSPEESNVFCIKNKQYKLIFYKTPNTFELFNLDKDPNEKNNIYGTNLKIEEILKQKLFEWINY